MNSINYVVENPVFQLWALIFAALTYIAVRDAYVRPIWKYLARLAVSFLIGVGGGPAVSALLGLDRGLVSSLLIVFAVAFLDELSNPRLIRSILKTKIGGNNEP